MIQRKQTVFLILALVLTIVCLCMPLGHITPKGMGEDLVVTNLGIAQALNYTGWPLMALLLITCPLNIFAIFAYSKRKMQMKLCTTCVVVCTLWYAYYLVSLMNTYTMLGAFRMNWTLCLPLVAIILYLMAHHAIKKDDDLVRSADRLR